ncbi:MAG: bifunctional glutamate N-acetyltransferase/amino-acid acetyltransferase ArgJ [Chloroflexi bacterium]|nr:bifunctional glutamate N-acetyltransferase/amino-acid acetyltransferase ArgJ [Chloroflexota bacterium]
MQFIPGGSVTSPSGFVAGATFAGLKTYGEHKLDLGLLMSQQPCVAAGTFTTNAVKSASVVLTSDHVAKGQVRAVVANSGIANACVGEQGLRDAQETVGLAARHLGLKDNEVAICSTGIIGVELPMALIRAGIPKVQLSAEGGLPFARSIMTTDSRPKEAALTVEIDGKTVTIGGCVKGSGMIHPNMATMLAFLTTDAAVTPALLRSMLKEAVNSSFNMVSVDRDTSTNDTVLLFANGACGLPPISGGSKAAAILGQAVTEMCSYLAKEIVRDAEGSRKVFEVRVEGARTLEDARKAARSIASSSLVKTAVHGNDPNWGRIVCALGYSGAEVDEKRVGLYINEVCLMENGMPIPFFKDAVIAIMRNPEVSFGIRLNLGDATATAWGCELTEEYVTFNSAYTT